MSNILPISTKCKRRGRRIHLRMNQIDKLLNRASLHQIREFLISGLEEVEKNYEPYPERLKQSSDPVFRRLKQVYSDSAELDVATEEFLLTLNTYQDIYLEMGMKIGARLFFELVSSDTIIKSM